MLPFRGNVAPIKDVHDPVWALWFRRRPGHERSARRHRAVDTERPLSTAAAAIAGGSFDVSVSLWHRGHAGTAAQPAHARSCRVRVRGACSRPHADVEPRYGTEDVYDGALSALNAVSRAIAPATAQCILRTYVMIIVATSALIGSTALLTAPGFGFAVPRTSITAPTFSSSSSSLAGRLPLPLRDRRWPQSSRSERSATVSP